MSYRLLADLVVLAHFAFLVFVVAGGFVARRHRWLRIPHLLAAAWGVYVETAPGMVCPLTPLENDLALRAGGAGYQGGFIEHYLVPVIYPEGLTQHMQWALAVLVVAVNVVAYARPRRRPLPIPPTGSRPGSR
jgi:hypothetical protein